MRKEIAVIVGRFQTPYLHLGHKYLIRSALDRNDRVMVLIGCSPLPLSHRNPLDFETRALMIRKEFPDVIVARLDDCRSDDVWSQNLDEVIESYFPASQAVLYGSRDSFIPHYHGKHRLEELEPYCLDGVQFSATNIRQEVSLMDSPEFRSGVIYASRAPFATSYQVVDVAVINPATRMILLGHKLEDRTKYRFIGGFVDPKDSNLEHAARREVYEETGMIETGDYRYLGSTRIHDWRYRDSCDQVMSAFFKAIYVFGCPIATDDLDEVVWFNLEELEKLLIAEHLPLLGLLKKSEV